MNFLLPITAVLTVAMNCMDDKTADGRTTCIGGGGICSGSYVMGFVLADQQGWLISASAPPITTTTSTTSTPVSAAAAPASTPANPPPFASITPLQTFANLRSGVTDTSSTIDFFMWEHFTTKRYFDNGDLKRVGEIYTPWPSWAIVASPGIIHDQQNRLDIFISKLNLGVKYFNRHHDEAVEYISSNLDYSEEDARNWLGTVRFAEDVKGVERGIVERVVGTLRKAGVLDVKEEGFWKEKIGGMAAFWRDG